MRVVYFGSGAFAVPSLRWLVNSRHEVVLVVTQPDKPAGRGKKLMPTPVAERAMEEGLPLEKVENVNDPSFIDQLKTFNADIGVVAAFGQKVLEPVRLVFPSECINLHASLLPKYRGAAPINAAILAGETKTGVTAFRLVDRMDAGPMLVKRETRIGVQENAGALHDRLAGVACDALDATLQLYEQDPLPPGEPQDESEATKAPKLKKSDGYIDFTTTAVHIERLTRAMSPWPGARCELVYGEGKRAAVTLQSVTAIPTPTDGKPGEVSPELTVATGDGVIEIHGLQPAGKMPMSWQDFVNGRHVKPGDRFESPVP